MIDENERMVEYAEMTAFNFNSKEYKEVCSDFVDVKEKTIKFDWEVVNFFRNFRKAENV